MKASYKIALICTMLVCSVLIWRLKDVNGELEARGDNFTRTVAENATPPGPASVDGSMRGGEFDGGTSGITIERVTPERFIDNSADRFDPSNVIAVGGEGAPVGSQQEQPAVRQLSNTVTSEAQSDGTYVVQSGDTFQRISQRLYGTTAHWASIAQANPLLDPRKLKPGDVIRLPDASARNRDSSNEVSPPGATIEYIVQNGDNLSSIAKRFYGTSRRWRIIYNTNRRVIGSSPSELKAGTKIIIPPVPGD